MTPGVLAAPALELRGASLSYGERVLWSGLDLEVRSGEFLAVLGANDDRIATPSDVNATALVYGVTPTIVPGLAHMMMLENDWQTVAEPLLDWLTREATAKR